MSSQEEIAVKSQMSQIKLGYSLGSPTKGYSLSRKRKAWLKRDFLVFSKRHLGGAVRAILGR